MTVALEIAVGLAAGLVLGWLYFRGLWLTVRRVVETRRPTLLLSSFIGRAVLLVLAAAALTAWSLPAAAAAGIAFAVIRRILLTRHRRALA